MEKTYKIYCVTVGHREYTGIGYIRHAPMAWRNDDAVPVEAILDTATNTVVFMGLKLKVKNIGQGHSGVCVTIDAEIGLWNVALYTRDPVGDGSAQNAEWISRRDIKASMEWGSGVGNLLFWLLGATAGTR
jgi:hypothetical protein